MRNYSSPRIIQLSIPPPVAQPCPPQEDTAGCGCEIPPGQHAADTLRAARLAISQRTLRSALYVLGVHSFAFLQPTPHGSYFAGT